MSSVRRISTAALLRTIGAGEPIRDKANSGHSRLFHRYDGKTFRVTEPIDDQAATPADGGTIAFRCNSPEQVRELQDVAVAHGTSIEDASGLPDSSMGPVYPACVRDPEGNKRCAIRRGQ